LSSAVIKKSKAIIVDANHHIKLQDSDKLDIIQSSATPDVDTDDFFELKRDTLEQEVGYQVNE
jgi:hypothetical protein